MVQDSRFKAVLSCAQQLQCRYGNGKLNSQAPPTMQHKTNKTDKTSERNNNINEIVQEESIYKYIEYDLQINKLLDANR